MKFTWISLAACALLLAFSASDSEAMFHKKKKSKDKTLQVCIQAATKTCDKTASDECAGKSGYKKSLCEKTSKRACVKSAEAACEKKAG